MAELAPPFVVFALPRSRTFWCSRWLSYGGWAVTHEELLRLRSLDDIKSWLAMPGAGTVETAGAPFWRTLHELRPDARIATIRRDPEACLESLCRTIPQCDVGGTRKILRHLEAKLDTIEQRVAAVCRVDYAELSTPDGARRLFEHCLPFAFDAQWWQAYEPLNLQCNLPALQRYYVAHAAQLKKLSAQVKQRTIARMAKPVADEAVTFQAEPFTWQTFREAIPLFREHLVQTDQSPDDYCRKNLPLFERLANLGALHVTTARMNGRLFGYLVSVVSPTLDAPGKTQATHTIFFADAGIKGLGLKLQRAAIETLKARGVDEVLMRAGHRGAGPRLGTFYRRVGAHEFGQLYRLELGEAA